MNRPYIICHMMSSVDGRIDCAMTEKLPGVEEYYSTLTSLNTPTTVSGRVTAQTEITSGGLYAAKDGTPIGREGFCKLADAEGYEVVTDTRGTLLWADDRESDIPHIIIVSELASREYLDYLESRHISWIACGRERIDLARACEIMHDNFCVRRMAIVGGGRINAGFLDAGLIDEVSLVIGAGIDGRGGMTAVFDGLPEDREVFTLKLEGVKAFDSGAVWIRYSVK